MRPRFASRRRLAGTGAAGALGPSSRRLATQAPALAARRMVFSFTAPAATGLLPRVRLFINSRPCPALRFFRRNTAPFISFFNMLCLPFLLRRVFRFIATRHDSLLRIMKRFQTSIRRSKTSAERIRTPFAASQRRHSCASANPIATSFHTGFSLESQAPLANDDDG